MVLPAAQSAPRPPPVTPRNYSPVTTLNCPPLAHQSRTPLFFLGRLVEPWSSYRLCSSWPLSLAAGATLEAMRMRLMCIIRKMLILSTHQANFIHSQTRTAGRAASPWVEVVDRDMLFNLTVGMNCCSSLMGRAVSLVHFSASSLHGQRAAARARRLYR